MNFMADPTYLDRLYNEIGQLGERVRSNLTNPSMILQNATTPYLSMEEQARLQAQQIKEDYMAMQESTMPTDQGYNQPAIPGLDPRSQYIEYLQKNAEVLKNPEYLPPTEEQWQQYFMRGEAPQKVVANVPKAIPVAPADAEVTSVMPTQPQAAQAARPSVMPVVSPDSEVGSTKATAAEAALSRKERSKAILEKINQLPYEADRYEAKRRLIENARLNKINELHRYTDSLAQQGYPMSELRGFTEMKLKQIDENHKVPKPIEESAQYKAAEKNWDGGLRSRQKNLVSAYNVIKESQNLMDVDPEKATIFMRQAMIKPLQSIISSEATQVSDLLVQFQDLLNLPAFAQLTGKKITNPSALFNKYLSLEEKDRGTFAEDLRKAIIEANPGRALENAIYTVNSYIDGYNKDVNDQVISPTSPKIAKQLGAVQFQPLENRQPKSEVQVVRPGQQLRAPMPAISPEQARAEIQRRQAARANQQVDLTGKQGF